MTNMNQLNKEQKHSQLNPVIYPDEIIRLNGRYKNSDLPNETKFPVLLPRNEHFTQLLIANIHERNCHAGVAHTLAQLRKKYWIPQGRTAIRQVIRNCLTCIRYQGGPYQTKVMSPWPRSKTTESSPFTNTGVDYFGPLYVKNRGNWKNVWICLFICTAVRAVHLEVVEDMTAEHFLEAFRRFIARRGKPNKIISDNAATFKAAKNAIDIAWNDITRDREVHSYLSENRIEWKFIIELSLDGRVLRKTCGNNKNSIKKDYWETIFNSYPTTNHHHRS